MSKSFFFHFFIVNNTNFYILQREFVLFQILSAKFKNKVTHPKQTKPDRHTTANEIKENNLYSQRVPYYFIKS